MKNICINFSVVLFSGLLISCSEQPFKINLETETNSPQIKFAISKLREAEKLQTLTYGENELNIVVKIDADKFKNEAFEISNMNDKVQITGGDDEDRQDREGRHVGAQETGYR